MLTIIASLLLAQVEDPAAVRAKLAIAIAVQSLKPAVASREPAPAQSATRPEPPQHVHKPTPKRSFNDLWDEAAASGKPLLVGLDCASGDAVASVSVSGATRHHCLCAGERHPLPRRPTARGRRPSRGQRHAEPVVASAGSAKGGEPTGGPFSRQTRSRSAPAANC